MACATLWLGDRVQVPSCLVIWRFGVFSALGARAFADCRCGLLSHSFWLPRPATLTALLFPQLAF